MEYEIWVRKLRVLRESRGWRQQDVADKIRLSRSQYSAIENGASEIGYRHIYNLAKAFGMAVSDLMSMKGVSLRGSIANRQTRMS